MDITRPDGKPTKAGISSSDNLGGQFAFLALAAALELRDRTGIAVHFDLSMQDLSLWASQLEWNGKRSDRPAIVRASDGYVAIDDPAVAAEAQALRTCRAKRCWPRSTSNDRAAPVLTVSEVFRHPQTIARGLLADCPTPEGDVWTVFSLPFRMALHADERSACDGTSWRNRCRSSSRCRARRSRSKMRAFAGRIAIVNVRTF